MTKQNSSLNVKDALASSEAFVLKRKKQIFGLVVALVAVFGGYLGYTELIREPRNEKAQSQITPGLGFMSQAQQLSAQVAQIQAMPDSSLVQMLTAQGMLNNISADSTAIVIKNFRADQQEQLSSLYDKALKGDGRFPGFTKIAEGNNGDASNIATYLAGICYFRMGNYKEAIKFLSDYNTKGDKSVTPIVLAALANSYACDKQTEKAIENFKKAAEAADNQTLSPMYLIEAGKLLESQNKKAEAKAIYEEVKQKYPLYGASQQGMMSSELDKYIERVK